MKSAATPSPKRRPSPAASSPFSSPVSASSSSSSSSRSKLTVIAAAIAVLGGSCFQLGLMVGMDVGRRHCVDVGDGASSLSSSNADTGHLRDDRIQAKQSNCSCPGLPAENNAAQQLLRRSQRTPHESLRDERAETGTYQAASTAEAAGTGMGGRVPANEVDVDADQPQRVHDRYLQPKASNLIAGYEYVKRNDFVAVVDTGVPVDPNDNEKDDVLILYTSNSSLPNRTENSTGSPAEKAVENCLTLRVVLTEKDVDSNCIAIMGHPEESFHVHRFHRIHIAYPEKGGRNITIGKHLPLTHVPRTTETRGEEVRFVAIPDQPAMFRYLKELVSYLTQLQDTLDRLQPIARKAAKGKGRIVAMTVNQGQSELLVNFVCSARARNLDLSHVLVFATDTATATLALGLGVHAFDVQGAFGTIPTHAAKLYGDHDFGRIVLSKIYTVHLLVLLGHDVLLQDVDVVWYRNPLEFFSPHQNQQQQQPNRSRLEGFDMILQDDGNTAARFAPFFANTGVYFVRSNARTVYFYSYLVRMGDVLQKLRCDQEFIALYLSDHVSLTGLRIKVLGARTEHGKLFPGGLQFHNQIEYMQKLLRGEVKPYAFHISWTSNKINKLKFFSQMGEWRVKPVCLDDKGVVKVPATNATGTATTKAATAHVAAESCCSVEPIVECHFRDKPSIVDCRDSPANGVHGEPFWPTPFTGFATAAAASAA